MQAYLTGGEQPVGMYTSMSITSPGPCLLSDQKNIQKEFATRNINSVRDIDGAYASDRLAKFETRPQFLAERDFPESLPKPLTHTRNVPDRSLMVEDIDGAQFTLGGGMDRTNRHVNPLNPNYKLPSYHVSGGLFDMASTKPARDIMKVRDVNDFAPPRYKHTRDVLGVDDIDGAKADYNGYDSVRERFQEKLHTAARKAGKDPYAPRATNTEPPFPLTNPRFQDRTQRCTNLCAPKYTIHGIAIEDDPVRSRPKALPRLIENGTFSLRTDDVVGATTLTNPKRKERKEVRNIMNTQDVEGAQADTIKHSITSNRVTCPLFPVYQSLDDGSPVAALVKPLMPSESIEFPSTRIMKLRQEMGLGPVGGATNTMGTPSGRAVEGYSPIVSTRGKSPYGSAPTSSRGGGGSLVDTGGPTSNSNGNTVPNLDFGTMGSARGGGGGYMSGGGSAKGSAKASARSRPSAREVEIASVRDLPN